jgi:S1-C subfamily serine protease
MISLIAIAIMNGMILSLVIGLVARVFGVRLPPMGFLIAVLVLLISTPFALTVDGASLRENDRRLEAWSANSCVAPDVIAESVFVASEREYDLIGTGFMLEGDIAVTNRHVSEALEDAALFRSPDGTHYAGTMYYQASTRGSDIALYELEGAADVPRLRLATAEPQPGDALLVVGNYGDRERFHQSVVHVIDVAPGDAISGSDYSVLTRSMMVIPSAIGAVLHSVLGSSGDVHSVPTEISFNGDVGPGNSGSPIINCQGEVVGVLFAGRPFVLFADEQTSYGVSLESLKQELEYGEGVRPTETDESTT